MDQVGSTLQIVLLDDNFAVRQVLRTFLHQFARQHGLKFRIHTSADGVQGLGYIFTTKPDFIIIDTTLPKYSGRELLDYLTTNERYKSDQHNVIVLHDGHASLDLPQNYQVVNKRSLSFLVDILNTLSLGLATKGMVNQSEPKRGILFSVGKQALLFANWADQFMYRIMRRGLVSKIWIVPWFITQLLISVYLSLLQIFIPNAKDDNIQQQQQDLWAYRVRHFPTLVTILVALILLIVQIFAYILGGVAIFHLSGRIDTAVAVFGNGYTYRRSISVDYTKVSGSSNLADFPVLVTGTYSYLATTGNGGKVQNVNGYDIVFTSDDTGSTPLSFEIEEYDPTTGKLAAWVKISSLSYTANTIFYMFYGNNSVSTPQETPSAVWDSTFATVAHLAENPAGSAPQMLNSKTNTNQGTSGGTWASGDLVDGKVGKALNFTKSQSDRISFSDTHTGQPITVSAWIKGDELNSDYETIAMQPDTNNTTLAWLLYARAADSSTAYRASFRDSYTLSANNPVTDITLSTATWYYLVGVVDADNDQLKIYRDGVLRETTAACGTSSCQVRDTTRAIWIGGNETWGEHFDGIIDEFRISTNVRSADWIATEYNNQNAPTTFYQVGNESSGGTSITTTAIGTQTATMAVGSTNQYVGGGFVISADGATTITGINIREQGTVDAQTGLANVKLYYESDTSAPYDCASESYGGTETQFGSTGSFNGANGTSAFSGSVAISATSTMCAYVVLDVGAAAGYNSTLEIDIGNPNSDITATSGGDGSSSPVGISGTTTITSTATVTVATTGTQVTNLTRNGTNQYLGGLFQITVDSSAYVTGITISETGTIDASINIDNLKLFYDLDTSAPYDCASEAYSGTETQFGSTAATGFNAANGSAAFTGSVALTSSQTMCVYVVLDIASAATVGQTVDVQITNPSTQVVTNAANVTPGTAIAISGSSSVQNPTVTVSALGTQVVEALIPSTDLYIGGTFVFIPATTTAYVTSVTLTEHGTVNALTALDNIKMFYELDTSAPYDCASESYAGTEAQFGVTDDTGFNATSGNSTFTGSIPVPLSTALCMYNVLDVLSTALNTQTLDVRITAPSTGVLLSSGTAGPATVIGIAGTTTLRSPTTTVATIGTQIATVSAGNITTYIGGTLRMTVANIATNITSITISETGTIDAQTGLDNISLYYDLDTVTPFDCASVTFSGMEPRLGAVDTDGFSAANGSSTFTGSIALELNQALCVYPVMDVVSSTNNQTIEIQITNPSTQVITSAGTVTPATAIAIAGTTTVRTASVLLASGKTQIASVNSGTSDVYLGGVFAFIPAVANVTITSFTISEIGTVNAQTGLDNIKILYELDWEAPIDCGSVSYDGTESQFGATDTDGFSSSNGTSSFTGNIYFTTATSLCLYVMTDVTGSANDGETIEIQVTTASTDVVLGYGGALTATDPTTLPGTTTVASANTAPTVSSVSLNSGNNINLNENTTVSISWTATVTDTDGYPDISSANGRMYRSGVGSSCSADDNNCYVAASCPLSGCSGNSCTATCSASVYFHADSTDSDGAYSSEYWLGWVQAVDSASNTHNGTSPTSLTELNTLVALDIVNSIDYGPLLPGEDTNTTNPSVIVKNTGNAVIDIELYGTDLCPGACGTDIITANRQEYGLNGFTYGTGTDLSTSAIRVHTDLAKPTQSPTNSSRSVYWGIGLPAVLQSGSYSGSNSFVALLNL